MAQWSAMHKGCVIWFTGLSGAGKSTVSRLVAERLRAQGAKVELLDGDEVREHLSKGLGFSKEDRDENIRRIGFVCELLARNGVIAIAAAISPYRAVREELRQRIADFVEVYAECPLEVLAERDCTIHGSFRSLRAAARSRSNHPVGPGNARAKCRPDMGYTGTLRSHFV
jgi:adenylylsulfate kinase